jgi:periplasmic iron binding protein
MIALFSTIDNVFGRLFLSSLVLFVLNMVSAYAAEITIGPYAHVYHLSVGAVYLQSVCMTHLANQPGDVHLEADIHATQYNPNGFAVGEWIPYLRIAFTLEHLESHWKTRGVLVPMVANDGPHYGANVLMHGMGRYRLTYHVLPPDPAVFDRHQDPETGVAPWWKPFKVSWSFMYLGTGKKGGY